MCDAAIAHRYPALPAKRHGDTEKHTEQNSTQCNTFSTRVLVLALSGKRRLSALTGHRLPDSTKTSERGGIVTCHTPVTCHIKISYPGIRHEYSTWYQVLEYTDTV